uniref:Uncharacterized protein n=1 Tax=Graphocephala atropunctata TaxID=36148 RepID=A0A1B6L7E1_9HEMI
MGVGFLRDSKRGAVCVKLFLTKQQRHLSIFAKIGLSYSFESSFFGFNNFIMSQTFVRSFDIESINKTLKMQQKSVGDVSCVIWDAAIVLSKYLEILYSKNKEYFMNKQVIELGAGLGCAGLVASCLGAHVTMTDLPEVIENLKNNIECNKLVWESCGGNAQARSLKWGSSDIDAYSPPDVLIATDCVYYEESVEPLVQTMTALSSDKTEILVCQEERDTEQQQHAWKLFRDLFTKHFEYTKVPLKDQHSLYSSDEIVIFRGRKKSQLSLVN